MTNREFFARRWETEQPAFQRVLRAMPAGQLAYQPHERSASAAALAWQIAEEFRSLAEMTGKGEISYEPRPAPADASAILTNFDSAAAGVQKILGEMDDARWEGPAYFVMGGNVVSTSTVEDMFWGFLFDLIHHRGQLSTYLRPMGGKVPSIYGPSADDPGM
jgi:DinB family.